MLQTKTVTPELYRLLKEFMKIPDFDGLNLVGGTSLALRWGHRKSIDIDLFGKIDLNDNNFLKNLSSLGDVTILKSSKNIKIIAINGIKVDFVNYKYKWIKKNTIINDIRFASIEDIAAMKINAITGRGTKKDFIDVYFLLKKYSPEQLIKYYQKKYTDGNIFLVKKSLLYFFDAETNEMPEMFYDIDWETIKKTISKRFNTYL